MKRRFLPLVLVLVYLMVPSSGEIAENVVHWFQHGDGAHAETAGHDDGDGTDEHGCSGTYHVCLCHHGSGFVASVASPALLAAPAVESLPTAWRFEAPRSVDFSDIFRPPIA